MAAVIKIENASVFIPGEINRQMVLRDITWQIQPNRHYALSGSNGSGKSTLLRLLHGELSPATGGIFWRYQSRYESSPIIGREITSLVSPAIQEFCQTQAWDVTAYDMLAGAFSHSSFANSCQDGLPGSQQDKIFSILEELHSGDLLQKKLLSLSQGQLRIILLARALLERPAVLLLDECTDGLDKFHKKIFFEVLKRHAGKCAIIYATHHPEELPDASITMRVIENGRLSEEKTASNIPKSGCNCSQRPLATIPCQLTQYPYPLIELANVNVYINRKLVLKNISWKLCQGEHWLIDGANGAGKSTFLRLLAGDEFIASGGHFRQWSPQLTSFVNTLDERRKTVSLVSSHFQADYGYPLTGLQLVCSGIFNSTGLFASVTEEEANFCLEEICSLFGRQEGRKVAGTSIRRLSTGQLRKLYLVRALMNRPDILLLDEPFTGLDSHTRADYLDFLSDAVLSGSYGFYPQIVFVSHYDEDIPAVITRKGRLADGVFTEYE